MADLVPILEMKHVSKAFPGVLALDDVHLRVFSGEVMALLGENGAGKSTLIKVLSGVYKQDEGGITYKGEALHITSPRNAMEQGIAVIHQELNLIPGLSVGENIFLGREPVKKTGNIDWTRMYGDALEVLQHLGADIDPKKAVAGLSIGDQQMVEIAKALSLDAQILILDEPTDALTDQESENLFRVIRELTAGGKAMVYISHRIPEVFQICDRVTILRDGQLIDEQPVANLDEDAIIERMVGRRLEEQIPYREVKPGKVVLKTEQLSSSACADVSFSICQGEVLGVAGLMGAGRTELALTLYGVLPVLSGTLELEGVSVAIENPKAAIQNGIAYVSEDRKQLGLFLGMSVKDNMVLPVLKYYEGLFFHIDHRGCDERVGEYVSQMSIKTSGLQQRVGNLSGGNQQKVAIAKGLITKPKFLILDEPTRGVDVGAKKEIYRLINELKEQGMAILMISSEMPELLGMSDRILVMHNGTIEGELSREEANQEAIMRLAVGMKETKGE